MRPQVYSSFQRQFRARPKNADDKVRVELLTDPWSVWCWGFEPVRRTLELRFPTIEFRFLLGGMFPTMPDHAATGFDVERFFEQVQRTTGMPAETAVLKNSRPESTFPACVSVHAAHIASPDLSDRYLRSLREAVYLDGRNISDPDVAYEVATVNGIDPDGFEDAISSGAAEDAFEERMQELRARGLFAYPTLLVTWRDRTAKVEGFHSLPAVLGIAEAVSGKVHAPLPDPSFADVIPPGDRVCTREVAEAFGVSVERAYDRLREQEDAGRLVRVRLAKTDVWFRAPDAL